MHETFIESSDGVQLYAQAVGEGPAVILSSGIGCDQYAWPYLVEQLKQDFRVVQWNYRGHGRSSAPSDSAAVTIEHLVGDLVTVCDGLGIDDAVHFGHSMGVQVILELSIQHPERVQALVPICGSYGHPLNTFQGTSAFKDLIFPTLYRTFTEDSGRFRDLWRKWIPTDLSYTIACLLEINSNLIRKKDFYPYLEHLSKMDMALFFRMLREAGEHSTEGRLDQIQAPTLIFAGDRDGFTPPSISQQMSEQIPGAELCIVRGGSHTAPLEQPKLFELRLEKFFREHGLVPGRS